jgi:hypothetical protein
VSVGEFYEVDVRLAGLDDDAPWRRVRIPGDNEELRLGKAEGIEIGRMYDLRVRLATDDGDFTDWKLISSIIVRPRRRTVPAPVDLGPVNCNSITWKMPEESRNLAGFEIRTAPDDHRHFDSAEPAHQGVVPGPPFQFCTVPGGLRSYLVRAVDVVGNVSEPTIIVAQLKDLSPAEQVVLHEEDFGASSFPGTIVGGSVGGGAIAGGLDPDDLFWGEDDVADAGLFYDGPDTSYFWDGPDSGGFWPVTGMLPSFWGNDDSQVFWQQRYLPLSYTATLSLDPSKLAPGAVLGLAPDVDGRGWRIEHRIESDLFWGEDDSSVFWVGDDADVFWLIDDAPWKPWPGQLAAQGGAIDVRITVPSDVEQPKINALVATSSAPTVEEHFTAAAISAAGGSRLALSARYRQILRVKDLTVRSGSAAVSALVADLDPERGPLIQLVDKEDAFAAGVVDATVEAIAYAG